MSENEVRRYLSTGEFFKRQFPIFLSPTGEPGGGGDDGGAEAEETSETTETQGGEGETEQAEDDENNYFSPGDNRKLDWRKPEERREIIKWARSQQSRADKLAANKSSSASSSTPPPSPQQIDILKLAEVIGTTVNQANQKWMNDLLAKGQEAERLAAEEAELRALPEAQRNTVMVQRELASIKKQLADNQTSVKTIVDQALAQRDQEWERRIYADKQVAKIESDIDSLKQDTDLAHWADDPENRDHLRSWYERKIRTSGKLPSISELRTQLKKWVRSPAAAEAEGEASANETEEMKLPGTPAAGSGKPKKISSTKKPKTLNEMIAQAIDLGRR